jgi:hypothetical protein
VAQKKPLKKGTSGIQKGFQNYCMFLDVFEDLVAALFVSETIIQQCFAAKG